MLNNIAVRKKKRGFRLMHTALRTIPSEALSEIASDGMLNRPETQQKCGLQSLAMHAHVRPTPAAQAEALRTHRPGRAEEAHLCSAGKAAGACRHNACLTVPPMTPTKPQRTRTARATGPAAADSIPATTAAGIDPT